jgi:hypothetical protein
MRSAAAACKTRCAEARSCVAVISVVPSCKAWLLGAKHGSGYLHHRFKEWSASSQGRASPN